MGNLSTFGRAGAMALGLAACTEPNPAQTIGFPDAAKVDAMADAGRMDTVTPDAFAPDALEIDAVIAQDAVIPTHDALLDAMASDGEVADASVVDASEAVDGGITPDAVMVPECEAVDCSDPACAQAPAVEVDFGQDGAVLTVFGQAPVTIQGSETRSLSCEAYNLGVPLDFLLNGRGADAQTQIIVRNNIAGVGVGVWVFDNNIDPYFQNGGQTPAGVPSIAIENGQYGPTGQAFEGFFPYNPQ